MALVLIEDSKTLKEVILSVEDTGYFKYETFDNEIDQFFGEIGLISRFVNRSNYEGILDDHIVSISLKNHGHANENSRIKMISTKFFFKNDPKYDQKKGVSDSAINLKTHRSNDLPYRSEFNGAGQILIHQWGYSDICVRENIKDPIYIEYNYTFPENKKFIQIGLYLKNETDFSVISFDKSYDKLNSFSLLINKKCLHLNESHFFKIIDFFPRLKNTITIQNIKELETELTIDEKKLLEMYLF